MRRNFVPACTDLETRLALSTASAAIAPPAVVTTIGQHGQIVHTEVGTTNPTLHLPKVGVH